MRLMRAVAALTAACLLMLPLPRAYAQQIAQPVFDGETGALLTPMPTPTPTPRPTPTPTPMVYPDTLEVSVGVSPSVLVEPGEVQVRVELANSGEYPIADVRLCLHNGEVLSDPVELAPGGTHTLYQTQALSLKQFEQGGVQYQVRYTLGKGTSGQKERSRSVLAAITSLPASPALEFNRTLSAHSAQPGETISLTYRVRNTGNITLTDLELKDPLYGVVGALEELAPGDKHTFTCSVTMVEACESEPSLSYSHRATSRRFSMDLPALPISLSTGALEAMLEADRAAVGVGDVVKLRIRIRNAGSLSCDGIRIYDQTLGEIGALAAPLRPGEEHTFEKEVSLRSTATFQMRVSGVTQSGSALNADSNMLTVAVSPGEEGASALSLVAEPGVCQTDGNARFVLRVMNEGEQDFTDVSISERTLGEVKHLAVAAPGETLVQALLPAEEAREYVFLAEMTDAQGGRLTVLSSPVVLAEGTSEAAPGEQDVFGALTGPAYRINPDASAFRSMLIGILVVIAAILCAFALKPSYVRPRERKRVRVHRPRPRQPAVQAPSMMEDTRPHIAVKRSDVSEEPRKE